MPRRLIYVLTVVVLLGQMAFAMVTTAFQQSPTIDEPVYVATAVVYQQQHSLRYNPEHPPLGKLAIAAGTWFEHATLDPAYRGNQTLLGRHLLYESGNNPSKLLLAARLPIILLTLLFGLVVLLFARDLAGPWAGLLALGLYTFDPDLIAHGSLATLDVPAAGLLITTFWLLWRARSRPWLYLPLAGVALGAALATRASTLPAVPVAVLLVLIGTKRTWLVRIGAALGVGLIAVGVVWLVYLMVDYRIVWSTPAGLHNPGGLKGLAVRLLPFPQPYRDGVLIQFRFEQEDFNTFLLGKAYHGRLWYYLPVALIIKTPLGMMALWAAGAVTLLWRRVTRVAALYLLVPVAVLFAVAMTGARDFGTRYVIFMPMFLAVVAGCAVTIGWNWVRERRGENAVVPGTPISSEPAISGPVSSETAALEPAALKSAGSETGAGSAIAVEKARRPVPVSGILAALLVVFVAVSSLMTFPDYIPYENEAFGGPSRTHLHLHDSNVDWGQDLPRLATRLKQDYPGRKIWLVYKGAGVPSYYGITAANPLAVPADQVHGILVVSDSRVALATGALKKLIDTAMPIDEVGYSMTIYER